MMDFTHDEMNLMMLYSPGTLSGLREALTQMKEQLAEAIRLISDNRSKVDKLVTKLLEKNHLNKEEIEEVLS